MEFCKTALAEARLQRRTAIWATTPRRSRSALAAEPRLPRRLRLLRRSRKVPTKSTRRQNRRRQTRQRPDRWFRRWSRPDCRFRRLVCPDFPEVRFRSTQKTDIGRRSIIIRLWGRQWRCRLVENRKSI
jgi:hypothetical protein